MVEKMLAVAFEEPGGPEVLKVVERERPVPGPTEVLVRVHAAGVNPVDWKTRAVAPCTSPVTASWGGTCRGWWRPSASA